MIEQSISVSREKFTVKDVKNDDNTMVAASNRMTLPLPHEDSLLREDFVIRGKFMHEVARMGALMIRNYHRLGPFMNRTEKFDWDDAFFKLQGSYERAYVDDDWICIYNKGKIVYQNGKHHPFFDIIEKCDFKNTGEYDFSVAMAEEAFGAAGRNVQIKHESKLALVAHAFQDKVRCGVIDRNLTRTRTFNFSVEKREDDEKAKTPEASPCVHHASSFLEGLHHCFKVGLFNIQLKRGQVEKNSDAHEQQKKSLKIIRELNTEINAFNNSYNVKYRPEMPDFDITIKEVEQKLLSE